MLVSLRLSDEPIKIGDSVERHAHGYVVGGTHALNYGYSLVRIKPWLQNHFVDTTQMVTLLSLSLLLCNAIRESRVH